MGTRYAAKNCKVLYLLGLQPPEILAFIFGGTYSRRKAKVSRSHVVTQTMLSCGVHILEQTNLCL